MPSTLTRILQAAAGYLELHLPQQAEAEMENLEGEDRTCLKAWVLRCKIYRATEQWDAMRDMAKHLVSLAPLELEYWLWAALATEKAGNPGGSSRDPEVCQEAPP